MTDRERLLSTFLKINAVVFSMAFPAVFLPGDFMADLSARASFGSLPQLPIVLYLARSLSLIYGMQGILFWFLSRDIERYTPIIRLQAYIWIISGTGFAAIDLFEGLPVYWAVAESISAWFIAGVLLFLTAERK